MKALIASWMLLLLWIGGFFIWDYAQFHSIIAPKLEIFFPRKEIVWDNFLESYSFRVTPSTKYSEECCFRFHLLRRQLNNPSTLITGCY
jgi:hypothetical protein